MSSLFLLFALLLWQMLSIMLNNLLNLNSPEVHDEQLCICLVHCSHVISYF